MNDHLARVFMSTHRLTTLENGLRIIVEETPHVDSVSVFVGAKVGSRHETSKQQGISHFLEHMAFKGTNTRSAQDIAEQFDAIGGYLNAYTDREQTMYCAKVLKDDAELAIDVLADILQHSVFDTQEIERERQVILQEIAQSNDTPDDLIFDLYQHLAFPNQALGHPILGTEDHVEAFTRDDLMCYMQQHYVPPSMVVSIAGNITNAHAIELATRYFGEMPACTSTRPAPEKGHYHGGITIHSQDLEQVQLLLGFEGLPYEDDEYYTLQVLSTLIGGGMSSRLFQEVREKRGLAYTTHAFVSAYDDTGLFTMHAGTAPEKTQELATVMTETLHSATTTITEEERKRAIAQLRASILMGTESVTNRAEDLARHYLLYGRFISPQEMITQIESVTVEALQQRLEATIARTPTAIAMGNIKELDIYNTHVVASV